MLMQDYLGLNPCQPIRESVSILVGSNGSGKSSFLRDLAVSQRGDRDIVIVCNTPHDRFIGLTGVRRMSAGKPSGSPRSIVKNVVAHSLATSSSAFYQLGSTLEYCGYGARFGFRMDPSALYGSSFDEVLSSIQGNNAPPSRFFWQEKKDMELAFSFLQRHNPSELVWIDSSKSALEFSRAREFASVLKYESSLRAWKVLRGIHVYLERIDDGAVIEMQHASSGQLALISSLLFMIANSGINPIVIIDEPENSLHPKWQREYIRNITTALSYRNATIIIATHAPLLVTGALSHNPELISVFQVRDGYPQRLQIDFEGSSTGSIEEILWRAFEVVTPANHFLSEQIVDEVTRFEKGEVTKEEVLALIHRMENKSFDKRQQDFFKAVRGLLDQVEAGQGKNSVMNDDR